MADLDFTTDFGKRALARLDSEQVAWLTTTGNDGTPQSTPVWFFRNDDNSIAIYSQPDTGKVRAIARTPRVSLNLNCSFHGDDVVVLVGDAAVGGGLPPAHENHAFIAKYADGIASIDMTPEAFAAEFSVPVRVVPTRLRGW